MKKILSFILCISFFNLTLCPTVIADEAIQPEDTNQVVTNSETESSADVSNQVQSPTAEQAVTNNDSSETAAQEQAQNTAAATQTQTENTVQQSNFDNKTEHLAIFKKNQKKINVESVYISSHDVIIPAQDILQVAFVSDFNGRKAHIGDTIEFRFPNDIVTQEGTMIIPSTARIIAEITNLKKPKPFHLSGKVYLNFKYLEINGTRKPIDAKLYGKKDFLSRKSLNNTTAVGETAVTTGAGAVTGAVIAASTTTNIAFLIFGTAISAGAGAIAGAALGILLPGASFKAKAGQKVNIELTEELDI